MARTIKELAADLSHVKHYVNIRYRPPGYTPFVKGNTKAAAENMSPESNYRRMRALGKATMNFVKRFNNLPGAPKTTSAEKKAKKIRLRYRVAAEAQQLQNKARGMAMQALDEVSRIITDPNAQHAVKIQAAALLWDRAYGKASQVNINASIDPDAKAKDLTPEQLAKRIEATLKRVEEVTGRVPETPESEEQPPDIRLRH
jgi:hypothetical protein